MAFLVLGSNNSSTAIFLPSPRRRPFCWSSNEVSMEKCPYENFLLGHSSLRQYCLTLRTPTPHLAQQRSSPWLAGRPSLPGPFSARRCASIAIWESIAPATAAPRRGPRFRRCSDSRPWSERD